MSETIFVKTEVKEELEESILPAENMIEEQISIKEEKIDDRAIWKNHSSENGSKMFTENSVEKEETNDEDKSFSYHIFLRGLRNSQRTSSSHIQTMNKNPTGKKNYDVDQMLLAVAAVRNGVRYKDAAKAYGVPYTTLHDKVNGKYTKSRKGPRSALSENKEQELVEYLIYMTKIGYALTKKDVRYIVRDVLGKEDDKRLSNNMAPNHIFGENNLPSTTWLCRFLSRWPTLSCLIPENQEYQRLAATEESLKTWFGNLKNFLMDEHNLVAEEFLTKANGDRIFHLDEAVFPLFGTNGELEVMTEKGSTCLYKMAPDSKEQITVLCCTSASGTYSKPFIIYPGVRQGCNSNDVNEEDYDVGHSPNGWMSSDAFFGWLKDSFYTRLVNKIHFPIICFMDGHSTHMNMAIAKFCKSHDIILYCLPIDSSHIMPPLDIACFKPLRSQWNESLELFKKKYKGLAMTRTNFFQVFDECWKKSTVPEHSVSGFKKCGLVPFNPTAVPYERVTRNLNESLMSCNPSSDEERVGMMRMQQLFMSCLSPDIKDIFQQRIRKGYTIEEDSAMGCLWKYYKKMGEVLHNSTQNANSLPAAHSVADVSSIEQDETMEGHTVFSSNQIEVLFADDSSTEEPYAALSSPGTQSLVSSNTVPIPSTSFASSSNEKILFKDTDAHCGPHASALASASNSTEIYVTNVDKHASQLSSSAGSSLGRATATEVQQSHSSSEAYNHFEYSPFKNHLEISDDIIITREIIPCRQKIPVAILGEEYMKKTKRNRRL